MSPSVILALTSNTATSVKERVRKHYSSPFAMHPSTILLCLPPFQWHLGVMRHTTWRCPRLALPLQYLTLKVTTCWWVSQQLPPASPHNIASRLCKLLILQLGHSVESKLRPKMQL
ncbi:hypothetical protein DPEC_G00018820 [Dallia pectoralis]|uniref:Uncharacterized protein n=1 Tax=Dallia pectoralis TaxID=75939 RepID=A0ACC2HG67_DALPE|nr:hypothetical protein DPEC_G00018820 [Dallia pectoralis]